MANTETRRINVNKGEVIVLTFDLTKWGASSPGTPTVAQVIDLSTRKDVKATVAASPSIVSTTKFQVTFQNMDKGRDYAAYLQWIEGSNTYRLKVNLRSGRDA